LSQQFVGVICVRKKGIYLLFQELIPSTGTLHESGARL
jgi:hypothetical protein